jgi:hypothetical protein
MEPKFKEEIEGLLSKYTELLVGDDNEEMTEKVKVWILYNHIAKSMPALARHWNGTCPESKEEVKKLIMEIKELNEAKRKEENNRGE